jgi:hypothetical protein
MTRIALAVPLPGRTTLFELNPADTPVGEFPSTIKLLNGIMSVELKDGVPMLKASSASQFLIILPRALPERFVLEFELVPKACCNPADLSFEGTPAINQGPGSAHVLWDSDGYLAVIGGARDNYESPVPEELRVTTPGVMTSVMAVVEGTTIQLYTNGRRLFTLTDRRFVRSRSLRVHLGGQDDETQAVFLARMRVTGGSLPPAVVAGLPTPPPGRPERSAPAAVGGQAPAQSPPPSNPPGQAEPTPAPILPTPPPPSTGTSSPQAETPVPQPQPEAPARVERPENSARSPTPVTACAPAQPTSGFPGPRQLILQSPRQSPGGADLAWLPVTDAVGYAVERGESGSAVRVTIATSCDAPAAFGQVMVSGRGDTAYVGFQDRTGGVGEGRGYTYMVYAYSRLGSRGWSSIEWTAPVVTAPRFTAARDGSTIRISWNCRPDPNVQAARDFLLTTSYGFTKVVSSGPGCGSESLLGVPVGTHTITIEARWPPDVTRSGTQVIEVSPTSGGPETPAGTSPSALPASRAIALNAVRASGGSSTAAGGAILPSSRTIALAGLAATGPTRVP